MRKSDLNQQVGKKHIDPATDHTLLDIAVCFPFYTNLPSLPLIMLQMVQWKMALDAVVILIDNFCMSQWPPSRPLPRQQFFVPNVPVDSAAPLQETMVGGNLKGWNLMIQRLHKCIKVSHLPTQHKSIPRTQKRKGKKSILVGRCRPKNCRLATSPFLCL